MFWFSCLSSPVYFWLVFRSLLILDDVWDTTVLKAFDIHSRVLLTTRNRALADSVSGTCPLFGFTHAHFNDLNLLLFILIYNGKDFCAYKMYVLCSYFVGAKYLVEVESGLDENKGMEILALYTKTEVCALPEDARSIVRECKGL